jgi:hypothetical protein
VLIFFFPHREAIEQAKDDYWRVVRRLDLTVAFFSPLCKQLLPQITDAFLTET